MNIFRSAIRGADGEVDVGYLSLLMLIVIVIGVIPFMCGAAAVAMYLDKAHRFPLQELGIGVGAVCGGFATALGALGLFRAGDRHGDKKDPA